MKGWCYINDAIREWLYDKPLFILTPKGPVSPEDLIAEDDKRMSGIAKKIVKDRYGEIEPVVKETADE